LGSTNWEILCSNDTTLQSVNGAPSCKTYTGEFDTTKMYYIILNLTKPDGTLSETKFGLPATYVFNNINSDKASGSYLCVGDCNQDVAIMSANAAQANGEWLDGYDLKNIHKNGLALAPYPYPFYAMKTGESLVQGVASNTASLQLANEGICGTGDFISDCLKSPINTMRLCQMVHQSLCFI